MSISSKCLEQQKTKVWFSLNYICPLKCFLPIIDIFQTVPPLHEILEQLSPIDSQWQEIGQALELSQNFLTGLAQSSKSNKIKLCALLQQWLENQYIREDAVTWEVAIAAVESGIVGKKAIAQKMRQYLSELLLYCRFYSTLYP